MSLVTYKAFVDRMISKYEGGYGWDANDPGGPTKYGITCYDLAEHLGERMTSMACVGSACQSHGAVRRRGDLRHEVCDRCPV
jgi:hypothetical protein